MICRLKVENFKAFSEPVEVNFIANNNIKRLDWNLSRHDNISVVKTAGFYGPNNTGKTCILLSLANLKNLMINNPVSNMINSFANKGDITKFEVEYVIDNRFYEYIVHYNNHSKSYDFESLHKLDYSKDQYKPSKIQIVKRTHNSLSFHNLPQYLNVIERDKLAKLFSNSLPIMVSMTLNEDMLLKQAREDYLEFANSIEFIRMDEPVDISKTLSLMRENPKAEEFVKEFVKNCDLNIEDFGSGESMVSDINVDEQLSEISKMPLFPKESLKIYSSHNGYKVPSAFFDSTGTFKIIALSGYVFEAISKGKILLIDEIDSSLHHVITRSLVSLFNNGLNSKSQLLFSTHDVLLMDTKRLLRKDQIWLLDILNNYSSKIIRLSDEFTARSENGIRGSEDITHHYLSGRFGSVPSPDLFGALANAVGE